MEALSPDYLVSHTRPRDGVKTRHVCRLLSILVESKIYSRLPAPLTSDVLRSMRCFCLLVPDLEWLGGEHERRGKQGGNANDLEAVHEREEVRLSLQSRVHVRIRLP